MIADSRSRCHFHEGKNTSTTWIEYTTEITAVVFRGRAKKNKNVIIGAKNIKSVIVTEQTTAVNAH